jgi:hypothetical protein
MGQLPAPDARDLGAGLDHHLASALTHHRHLCRLFIVFALLQRLTGSPLVRRSSLPDRCTSFRLLQITLKLRCGPWVMRRVFAVALLETVLRLYQSVYAPTTRSSSGPSRC